MTPEELFNYIILSIPFVLLLELAANVCVLSLAIFTKFLFPTAWAPAWFVASAEFVIALVCGIGFVLMDAKRWGMIE